MHMTIGDFLLKRLKEAGVEHIIGVPGDFNLEFLEQIRHTDGIEFVGATNELNAAYAADGYARMRGLSALTVTYGVGDLGAIGGVAGSSAEHVPVIVISGAPPLYVTRENLPVHHSLADGNFSDMANCYAELTALQTRLTPENAVTEIDRAIRTAQRVKKPVNLQLPSNISWLTIEVPDSPLEPAHYGSDQERLDAAVKKIRELYDKAQKPAVLIDLDVDRLGLTDDMEKLIEQTGMPYAAMNTGKAILSEQHPQYAGIYKGDDSEPGVQAMIEGADFLLTVSPRFIEWNSGAYSADLPECHTITISRGYTSIDAEIFEAVQADQLLKTVTAALTKSKKLPPVKKPSEPVFKKVSGKKLNHADFWKIINGIFREGDLIIGETGTANTALQGLRLPAKATYIGSQIWGAIGYMLPLAFGTMLAEPKRRQLLFIGDGSFQVTAQEFSSILRYKQNLIIFLINNDGYTIERYIMGRHAAYNDIAPWTYHQLPQVFAKDSRMKTFNVSTQGELDEALNSLDSISEGALIEVHLPAQDAPKAMEKFGETVAKFNFGPRGPKNPPPED